MNDTSKKASSKKRTKKAKQNLLTPEQKTLQAEKAAKKERLREIKFAIAAHAINLFQNYTALRKKGLDSPTATLQAHADYEKVHGHKFPNSMWTRIKTKAGIQIYDRERQDTRKSLNLAKIPTRLEAKRSVLTQNQKKIHNQNASTLRLIGGKKLPVTSMGLVVCPVCEIHVKDDAIEWHLRHNHVGHVDNPLTQPVVAPVDTVEDTDSRVNRTTGEKYISFWADKPEDTKRYLLQVYPNAIRVTLPFMGLELNSKCITKWFDTLEEAVEVRNLLIGDKKLSIESPAINIENNKEDKRYFNKQVYQTALLTMTQSEAWKLATDEEDSMIFLSDRYISPLTPPESNIETSLVMDGGATDINTELTKSLEAANDTCATGRTVEVTHKVRHAGDQADFKRRVWENFNGRCAVTGYSLPEGILEAAHIEAITEAANNNTSNGLLLEVSLHRMLDKGLMGINPDDLTVHFAIDCIHKSMFEGKTLQPHRVGLDTDKLTAKWKEFNDKS
ncbi:MULTISPECIES: HNH endonuclease signature motif containing protein [Citrobacter]|nr:MULTISPECIES: HNH endonuclease signature motif containing protein [Citrobacter]AUU26771.1 HNH endonuclease [Citrobacter freundii]AYL42949.1 HNH endonuclease [Citrobacter freundii]EKT8561639.1 HNH endonuclease [Citrobacter freundii]EKU0821592.1 HNH endonuclease [Citrobacter freundii]EKU6851977.1 HNH endonuclease [Citrobacter freundii]